MEEGHRNVLVVSCHKTKNKHWPDGPKGLNRAFFWHRKLTNINISLHSVKRTWL